MYLVSFSVSFSYQICPNRHGSTSFFTFVSCPYQNSTSDKLNCPEFSTFLSKLSLLIHSCTYSKSHCLNFCTLSLSKLFLLTGPHAAGQISSILRSILNKIATNKKGRPAERPLALPGPFNGLVCLNGPCTLRSSAG